MDRETNYVDPVDFMMAVMKRELGSTITAYYDGNPVRIPKNNFPALMITEPAERTDLGATGQDKNQVELRITIALDKRADLGAEDTDGVNADVELTDRKLRKIIRERDPETGGYKRGTVMHGLRTHMTKNGWSIDQRVDVKFQPQGRPGNQLTNEARVSIVLTEVVIRDDEQPLP